MSPRIVLFLAAAGLLVAAPLRAEAPLARESGAPLLNWTSAPYWQAEARSDQAETRVALDTLAVTPIDPGPLPFVALSPCRVADTRGFGFTGAYGPPALTGGSARAFPMAGQCGIPASARAISVNFTVTNTGGAGFLGAFPQGSDYPGVSTLNFSAGQTLANAAIVPLSTAGGMSVVAGGAGFDLIIDVNGYYANPVTASSGAFDAKQLAMLRWWEAAQPYTAAISTGQPYPWGMAFDGLYLWVANSQSVSKILPSLNVVAATYTVLQSAQNLAFDGIHIWVAGSYSGAPVSKIRVSDGTVTTVPLAGYTAAYGIAFDGSALWVGANGKVLKLDPATGNLLTTVNLPAGYTNAKDVIFDGTYVWVAGNNATGTVFRVLASNPATTVEFATGYVYPSGLVYDGANVWITNYSNSSVSKMRASDGVVLATYPVGTNPRGIVFDGVNIWVGCDGSSNVYKLRAATGQQVGSPIPVATGVNKLGFDGAFVWAGGGTTTGYLVKL
ncbi:MAG: hypothetical protein IPP07_01395 [Holophagales bacterium]|nr:hypothetical protein [Holophagales bacterium]